VKAVTWHGRRDVRVETVPDPVLVEPTDAIIRVTSTGICGSDLHLYEVLGMFLDEGDILGHEPMGIVEEVGSGVTDLQPGDRVVVPFGIACGDCFMCGRGLQSQCETTQVREQGKGAALFGYTRLYGSIPGGQAEYLRVPMAHYGPIKVPEGPPDERYVMLSDVLPTAWQAVRYGDVEGCSVAVLGLGPIGQMCARIAGHLGAESVHAIDLVPERLSLAERWGIGTLTWTNGDDVAAALRDLTEGRGPDVVIDAVGLEAHGSAPEQVLQTLGGLLPDALADPITQAAGIDRLAALNTAIEAVRRGGTISLSGVYGGGADPLPLGTMFDKQIQLRMGQANVRRWVDEILPLLDDDDPLGVHDLVTHTLPLDDAPLAYELFQKKRDGAVKVLLQP